MADEKIYGLHREQAARYHHDRPFHASLFFETDEDHYNIPDSSMLRVLHFFLTRYLSIPLPRSARAQALTPDATPGDARGECGVVRHPGPPAGGVSRG